jgi:hypothetical protein
MSKVVKVEGVINGTKINFIRDGDTNDFIANIPPSFSGIYLMEIYAYDEFGNVGYSAVARVWVKQGRIINDRNQTSLAQDIKDRGGIINVSEIERTV